MRTIILPAKFYDDHCDRDLTAPTEIKRAGSRVWADADDEDGMSELYHDAMFYADDDGPDELPPGLKASAKRTVAAIVKAQP